jgi:competence protein ComEC
MARAPLVVAALAVAAGIALGLMRPVPAWGGPLLMPGALVGALGALALAVGKGREPRAGRGARWPLLLLAGAGLLMGAGTRAGADRSCARWLPADAPLTVVGTVTSATAGQLRVLVDSVRIAADRLPCGAELPVRWRGRGRPVHLSDDIAPGARIEGVGRWWTPPGSEPGILRRPGALLLDSAAVVAAGSGAPAAERLRQAGRDRVEALFGDQAALAASLLLAQRDGLDGDVRERFARAGLSHLLAISGLHVGLICGILLLTGSILRLGKRGAAVLAAVGTVGYVLMLGAPHSAIRAALQLVLLLAATMLQRPTRTEALIAAAALVLLLRDPGALLSPGFQLSFAGVIGLLVLRRPFLGLLGGAEPAGRVGRAWRWLADALATSTAATIATAPIVAWHFGHVAPVGIVANLVAIPLLSVTLPALAVSLAAGIVSTTAGAFLAGPGVLGLAALDRVAAVAATAPGAAVPLHGATALLLTGALAAGYVASRRLGSVRPGIRGGAWAAVAVLVLVVAPLRPSGDAVEIHMIDVGQGDAIAVRTPAGRWILVDAGLAGRGYDTGERRVVPYLARRGARRLEGLVLTHPHLDHTGGAEAVIRSLRPRWVGDPGSPSPSAHYLGLLTVARVENMRWVGLRQGAGIAVDGVAVEFLHPEAVGALADDPNDLSVVMRVAYGDFTALLTGDATALVEERLMRRYGEELRVEVLKVGHHGSNTSTTETFLEAAGPAVALVSAGRGNRYGHPHRVVVDRLERSGARLLRTDVHGSIIVRANGRGTVHIQTERGDS